MESPQQTADVTDLIELLEGRGYVITLRHVTWWECLLERGSERWLGAGTTEAGALHDALGRALPSALGRGLLADESARRRADTGSSAVVCGPAEEGGERSAPAPEVREGTEHEPAVRPPEESPPAQRGARPSPAASNPAPASVAAEQVADAPATGKSREPDASPRAPPLEAPASPAPAPPGREVRGLSALDPDEALAEVESQLAAIRSQADEVATWVPERQRLQILAWMAQARAVQDATPGREVKGSVTGVARLLQRMTARWWPGSVEAMKVSAYPAECAPALDLDGEEETPQSWYEVAELAERTLARLEQRDEERGTDERGWSDAAACRPYPPDAEARLSEVVSILERWMGPLGERPEPARLAPGDPPPLELVRRVRWLRTATLDAATWGAAMGRLRWLSGSYGVKDAGDLRRELHPDFVPPSSWARLLGHDPERRERARRRKELLERCPDAADEWNAADAVAWLRDALDVPDLSADRLADLVWPVRGVVLALDAQGFSGERKLRRRLLSVQAKLQDDEGEHLPPDRVRGEELRAAAEDLAAAGGEAPAAAVADEVSDAQDAMLAAVLPETRGKSALVVSNRADPQQDEMLRRTFEFALVDHEEASPRRLDAVATRIRSGRYDLVLSLTGFQNHSTDRKLLSAAEAASVRYVRANRGRRLACIQALYRDLGLVQPAG